MTKLETISTYLLFGFAVLTMGFGLFFTKDTWEVLAGFWMMMYLTERVSKN